MANTIFASAAAKQRVTEMFDRPNLSDGEIQDLFQSMYDANAFDNDQKVISEKDVDVWLSAAAVAKATSNQYSGTDRVVNDLLLRKDLPLGRRIDFFTQPEHFEDPKDAARVQEKLLGIFSNTDVDELLLGLGRPGKTPYAREHVALWFDAISRLENSAQGGAVSFANFSNRLYYLKTLSQSTFGSEGHRAQVLETIFSSNTNPESLVGYSVSNADKVDGVYGKISAQDFEVWRRAVRNFEVKNTPPYNYSLSTEISAQTTEEAKKQFAFDKLCKTVKFERAEDQQAIGRLVLAPNRKADASEKIAEVVQNRGFYTGDNEGESDQVFTAIEAKRFVDLANRFFQTNPRWGNTSDTATYVSHDFAYRVGFAMEVGKLKFDRPSDLVTVMAEIMDPATDCDAGTMNLTRSLYWASGNFDDSLKVVSAEIMDKWYRCVWQSRAKDKDGKYGFTDVFDLADGKPYAQRVRDYFANKTIAAEK